MFPYWHHPAQQTNRSHHYENESLEKQVGKCQTRSKLPKRKTQTHFHTWLRSFRHQNTAWTIIMPCILKSWNLGKTYACLPFNYAAENPWGHNFPKSLAETCSTFISTCSAASICHTTLIRIGSQQVNCDDTSLLMKRVKKYLWMDWSIQME